MEQANIVGVLGGLGPLATELFFSLVLRETEAHCDQDYPDLVIVNRSSTPDRTASLLSGGKNSPGPFMAEDARRLEKAGCCAIVIPCNTSHAWYGEVAGAVQIPVIHLIREVVLDAKRRGMSCLGILATEGTRMSRLYDEAAQEAGIRCVYPGAAGQKTVSHIIYDEMKAGLPANESELTGVFDELLRQGCDGLVLGCTELPIAYHELQLESRYPQALDSLRILARKTVQLAGKKLREE